MTRDWPRTVGGKLLQRILVTLGGIVMAWALLLIITH